MVLACIDVGSNAVRMLVASYEKGAWSRVRYERVTTRLGAFSTKGGLSSESRRRTLEALRRFSRILAASDVSFFRAVGTSALREAEGAASFIGEVLEETGISIDVISPVKEAQLTAKGVMGFIPGISDALILDMGGGSTEWIVIRKGSYSRCGSIPMGVVKIASQTARLGEAAVLKLMEEECLSFAAELKRQASPLPEQAILVLTGGAGSTIASVDLGLEGYDHELIHGHVIGLDKLAEIYTRLSGLAPDERKTVKGLEPDRADLIIPGIGLTMKIMTVFSFDRLTVSGTGLPEGVLLELSEKICDG